MTLALTANEQTLLDNTTSWINGLIDQRFTSPLPADFREMVADLLLEGFEAGAAWAEQQFIRSGQLADAPESRIIRGVA